jgi:hypothetical protein
MPGSAGFKTVEVGVPAWRVRFPSASARMPVGGHSDGAVTDGRSSPKLRASQARAGARQTTAGGTQGLQAINTMEFIVRALRAWAVPLVLPVAQAWQAFDEDGRVRDDMVARQLAALGAEVVRAARQMAVHGRCDYSEPWQ